MDTTTRTYPVAGGWHAADDKLFMACFGRDEAEARAALTRARTQAAALAEVARERREAGTLYGEV